MEKMEKLNVPKDLVIFFDSYVDMIGDDSVTFYIMDRLITGYHEHNFEDETRRFIYYNMTEISEVISGKREYGVYEDEFYALMIGHEKVQGTPHWGYDERLDGLSMYYYTGHHGVNIKMTKDEWNELGVDDSNADFTETL